MEDEFIVEAENKIMNLINELGWNYEYFKNINDNVPYVLCPNDSGHRLPADSLQYHLEHCDWVSEGYDPEELALSLSCPNGPSIIMTPELQENIIRNAAAMNPDFEIGWNFIVEAHPSGFCTYHPTIMTIGRAWSLLAGSSSVRSVPKTGNRSQQAFTRDERLALYEYVVNKTQPAVKIPIADLVLEQPAVESKRELTELEIAAAERDAKRRRASYRNKVHTNRKTHIEIMREVIESQMNGLLDDSMKIEEHSSNVTMKDHDGRHFSKHENSHTRQSSNKDRYHEKRYRRGDKSRLGTYLGSKRSRKTDKSSEEAQMGSGELYESHSQFYEDATNRDKRNEKIITIKKESSQELYYDSGSGSRCNESSQSERHGRDRHYQNLEFSLEDDDKDYSKSRHKKDKKKKHKKERKHKKKKKKQKRKRSDSSSSSSSSSAD